MITAMLIAAFFLALRGELFPAPPRQVTPAALNDVRSIGVVQAEDSREISYDGEFEITNTFVIDVGSASAKEVVGKVVSRLRERGWETIAKKETGAVMKSAKWKALVAVDPFYLEALQHHPGILQTLNGKSVNTDAYAIVRVDVVQGA
ncbi:hypothetical protein [Nonomuraea sp. NPDC049480]|uniref:hypothetical protein n=1 Tax=Nonomuraea sp. NPDC049480 TaxID=3364353 RepID=UPI0037B73243